MARKFIRRGIQDSCHPFQIHGKHDCRVEQEVSFRSHPRSRSGKLPALSGYLRFRVIDHKVIPARFACFNSAFLKRFQQYPLTDQLIQAVRRRYKGDIQIAHVLKDSAPAGAPSGDPVSERKRQDDDLPF